MAPIPRDRAVPNLGSTLVDDGVDLEQIKSVIKEKVRSRLSEADVDNFVC
jgi:hypothetical protein